MLTIFLEATDLHLILMKEMVQFTVHYAIHRFAVVFPVRGPAKMSECVLTSATSVRLLFDQRPRNLRDL